VRCALDAVELETQTAVTSRMLLVHEHRQEGCDTLARIKREPGSERGGWEGGIRDRSQNANGITRLKVWQAWPPNGR
jgi:hypothetical protein